MRRSYQDEDEYAFIENKVRELGGYDDASLLREIAEAERELENGKADHPEDADRPERELDERFELLKARIRERGIRPVSERVYAGCEKKKDRFQHLLCAINKIAIIFVVIMVLLAVGGGVVATAKNRCPYSVYPSSGQNIRMLSNYST